MKQRLQSLFESDKEGRSRKYTFDNIIEILKSIRKETVEFCNTQSTVITTPTKEQKRILELLEVKI